MHLLDKGSFISLNLILALVAGVVWLVRVSDKVDTATAMIDRNFAFSKELHKDVESLKIKFEKQNVEIDFFHQKKKNGW